MNRSRAQSLQFLVVVSALCAIFLMAATAIAWT